MNYATNPNLSQVTTSGPPLCKNCKHVRRGWFDALIGSWTFTTCIAVVERNIDVVSGAAMKEIPRYCLNERRDDYSCGPTGKRFEPRSA